MKKKIIISYLIGIITMLIIGSVGATILYNAKDIEYKDTNVQDAIDDLYDKYNYLKEHTNFLLYNGASIVKDEDNDYCINFDGVDDYAFLGELPSSINWAGGFTIEFKASFGAFNRWSRIIDFGNGPQSDNIVVANFNTTDSLTLHLVNNTTEIPYIQTGSVLELNEKANYKVKYIKNQSNYTVEYYKNDLLVHSLNTTFTIRNFTRRNNYLGRSNWTQDGYFKGKIYYLKIDLADGSNIININLNKIYK